MTSPQNDDVRIGIGYNLDEASVSRTNNALEATDKNILDIQAQAKAGSREIALFARAQANVAESSRDATKAINDSVEALRDETKAAEDSADAIAKRNKKLEDTPETRRQAQLDFADKSGNNASIAGSSRGAVDALTGGNSGAIGQILEGAEAIFDLGEAAGKVGGPIGDLVKGLGPGGLAGVAGAAGIALLILSQVLKDIQERTAQEVAAVATAADTVLKVNTALENGLTTEGATDLVEQAERNKKAALQTLDDVAAAQIKMLEEVFGGDVQRAAQSEAFQEFGKQRQELENSVANYDLEIRKVSEAMEDGTTAANDAAAAEQSLAAARTSSVLTEAAQAGELESLRLRAADLTQEQIDAELKALETREASIKAEIASLEDSGDTSEEVANKIAQLGEQLGFLGEQADVLKAAKPSAKSESAEKAAEDAAREQERRTQETARAQEQAAQESKRAADEARRAQDQYTQAVANAKNAYNDAVADIKTGLIDNLADINQDLANNLNEQSIEFNQNELKEEAQFQRDLARIHRDARRSEDEATRQRDFAAAADAREQAAQAIADRRDDERAANDEQLTEFQQAQEALGRERDIAIRDAQIDAQRQLRDAAIARDRSLRDARSAYDAQSKMQNGFHNQTLSADQKFYDSRLRMMQQFMDSARGSGGGRASGTSARSSGSSELSTADALNYMVGSSR